MQLHVARLCLDCQEIHAAAQCPACSSEVFAPLSRWVPPQERRARPRAAEDHDAAEAYRRLLGANNDEKAGSPWPKRIAFAVAAAGVGGWLWNRPRRGPSTSDRTGSPGE
jgi:hypothetical protein